MAASPTKDAASWTSQEVITLVNAYSKFQGDWNGILSDPSIVPLLATRTPQELFRKYQQATAASGQQGSSSSSSSTTPTPSTSTAPATATTNGTDAGSLDADGDSSMVDAAGGAAGSAGAGSAAPTSVTASAANAAAASAIPGPPSSALPAAPRTAAEESAVMTAPSVASGRRWSEEHARLLMYLYKKHSGHWLDIMRDASFHPIADEHENIDAIRNKADELMAIERAEEERRAAAERDALTRRITLTLERAWDPHTLVDSENEYLDTVRARKDPAYQFYMQHMREVLQLGPQTQVPLVVLRNSMRQKFGMADNDIFPIIYRVACEHQTESRPRVMSALMHDYFMKNDEVRRFEYKPASIPELTGHVSEDTPSFDVYAAAAFTMTNKMTQASLKRKITATPARQRPPSSSSSRRKRPASGSGQLGKKRGKYACGLCGQPKAGHTCPYKDRKKSQSGSRSRSRSQSQ